MHATRQKIIELLKEVREATVDEIAEAVDLTPMAVRYHLNILLDKKLITAPDVRRQRGPGRPQQIYCLTEAANDFFPEDYGTLTDYLLDELQVTLGKDGVAQMFNNIANRLVQEVPAPKKGQSFESRLNEVITFLGDRGFVVDWESDGLGYKIHARSCPYRDVAKNHEEVCMLDQRVISSMLNTKPTRIACLTNADNHCIYQVSKPISLVMDTVSSKNIGLESKH